MIHNFQKSLSYGKEVESVLDNYFSKWFHIENVTLEEEKQLGIDRKFHCDNRDIVTVEYKADRWTVKTGNIFIETSVAGNPGWAIKTQADMIIYAAMRGVTINTLYMMPNEWLKSMLPIWQEKCQQRTIKNNGFSGVGLLVPTSEMIEPVIVRKIRNSL